MPRSAPSVGLYVSSRVSVSMDSSGGGGGALPAMATGAIDSEEERTSSRMLQAGREWLG